MKIGITGHQRLEKDSDWYWISSEIKKNIKKLNNPLIGITSLAIGADQLFAKIVLEFSGALWVVVPFKEYDKIFQNEVDRNQYFSLLEKADKVEILEIKERNEGAYLAAGKRVVDLSDLMMAVWKGRRRQAWAAQEML